MCTLASLSLFLMVAVIILRNTVAASICDSDLVESTTDGSGCDGNISTCVGESQQIREWELIFHSPQKISNVTIMYGSDDSHKVNKIIVDKGTYTLKYINFVTNTFSMDQQDTVHSVLLTTNESHIVFCDLEIGIDKEDTGDSRVGTIAGVIVAIVVAIIILIIAIVRRKKASKKACPRNTDAESANGLPSQRSAPPRPMGRSREVEAAFSPDSGVYINNKISEPIPLDDFYRYTTHVKSTPNGFLDEYKLLPTKKEFTTTVASDSENKSRNRYKNIHPYDYSRVKLEVGEGQSDYINASYIKPYFSDKDQTGYIASQGPLKGQTGDFWKMIWQQNVSCLVMVTNLVEKGKSKCEQYWPEEGVATHGDYKIKKVEVEKFADYSIRVLNVSYQSSHRVVYHHHFTGWPDHGVPPIASSLLELRRKVRGLGSNKTGPLIVHCSAGVGRTGTYIAIDYLLEQAKAEFTMDILACVKEMRTSRMHMVQTEDQYVFIYDALAEATLSMDTIVPANILSKTLAQISSSQHGKKSRIAEQFEVLEVLKPAKLSKEKVDALTPANITKNKQKTIIPGNKDRPFLSTEVTGTTNYINAVFIKGYRQKEAYIITQTPMTNTMCDIWRMVWDLGLSTIVMLQEEGEETEPYWPLVGESPLMFGPLTVTITNQRKIPAAQSGDSFTLRDFIVERKRSTNQRRVQQYVIDVPRQDRDEESSSRPQRTSFPIAACIEVLQCVEKWQQNTGNHPVTIHCWDGAFLSGVFCAMSFLIEKLKVDQEVDAFNTVRQIRLTRPQLVHNLLQYRMIHEAALHYVNNLEAYSNFK